MPIQPLENSSMFVMICEGKNCGRDLTIDSLDIAIDYGWIFDSRNIEKGAVICPDCWERELEEGI